MDKGPKPAHDRRVPSEDPDLLDLTTATRLCLENAPHWTMPALILRDPASNFAACRFRPESEFLFHLLSEDGRVLEFKSVEAVLEAGWRLVTTARAKESPLRNSPPLQSRWDARPS
ncbi:MAG: hypothetical protein H7A21_19170 [Spirochaetales bacterium]|nr:hypothetical protein [Leptospiraceae bacterium]MCP5483567.1 hypothetical protein [Spirochaetales bacterium]